MRLRQIETGAESFHHSTRLGEDHIVIVYRLQGMEFEWDEHKAKTNTEKHGVTFEEAVEVFFDPFYQTGDATGEADEVRDFILGYTSMSRLLLVVHTERSPRISVISARPATRAERRI